MQWASEGSENITCLEEIYYLNIGVWRKNIPLVLFIFQLRKQKPLRVLGYIWYTHARVQVYAHECMQRPDQASSTTFHLNALSWDGHVLAETTHLQGSDGLPGSSQDSPVSGPSTLEFYVCSHAALFIWEPEIQTQALTPTWQSLTESPPQTPKPTVTFLILKSQSFISNN